MAFASSSRSALGRSIFVRFPQPLNREGLVMLDGKLSTDWMLSAYEQGVFPWPIVDGEYEQLAWFSPNPRAILPLDRFRTSRRLARRLRRGEFQLTMNRAFRRVVEQCAQPRSADEGVWLTESMARAYADLRSIEAAHSIEAWQDGELVGGVLGIALGGLFSAESMFHLRSDAGKAALSHLVSRLRACGFQLVDVQQSSTHMTAQGAIEISRDEYLAKLEQAIQLKVALS